VLAGKRSKRLVLHDPYRVGLGSGQMTALDPAARGGETRHSAGRKLFATSTLALGFVLLGIALTSYTARDGLANLYGRWRFEEEYSYGLLIAALVPVLLWRRWPVLLAEAAGSRWPGLVVLVMAQLCAVVAVGGESYYLEQIAFIVSLFAFGLIIFGNAATRTLLPIALILLLTLPLPFTLQAMLTIKLQLMSTNLGVVFIRLLGIPVYVEGNIIDLGSYKLQVAEACSGLRYLLPLICISFLIAYLYKAPFWKKAVVVISAAPITILINSFRIAVTAVLVNNFGNQMAEGFFHEFEGWVVFLAGVLLLGLTIFILEGFRRSKVEIESIADRSWTSTLAGPITTTLPLIIAVLVCAAALGMTTSLVESYQSMPKMTRQSFADFPERIAGWAGAPIAIDPETLSGLKDTDTYNGDFSEAPAAGSHVAAPVSLFVAYYDSLSTAAAIHSPRVCLPGSGWEFASFEERNFNDVVDGATGTYNHIVIQKGEQKILMYYWYQQRERRTADEFGMKYYVLVDNLFKGRKDGALVRLYTPIVSSAGDNAEAEANTRLRSFAAALVPKLPNYLPE
jgi:exosortase D (VPLPA-CTERM-specific)